MSLTTISQEETKMNSHLPFNNCLVSRKFTLPDHEVPCNITVIFDTRLNFNKCNTSLRYTF